ncbi:MAG TPA: hypothetical protein VGL19_14890 [Polyangiaceae bacterium]
MALCLALAAGGAALIALRSHRDHAIDTLLATDTPAQQRLRDGWRELGTLASSFPPVIAAPAPTAETSPEQGPSGSLSTQGTGDGLGGNGGNGGSDNVAGGGIGGNAPPPRPTDRTQLAGQGPFAVGLGLPATQPAAAPGPMSSPLQGAVSAVSGTVPAMSGPVSAVSGAVPPGFAGAEPGARPLPASSASPAGGMFNFSSQSALCGPNTCNLGQVCCNASCGTCTAPGATCDQKRCDSAIQYPASQACGLTTCNIDSVCCNPSCGICTAPGDECSQRACG